MFVMNFPETVYTVDVLVFGLVGWMAFSGWRRGFCREVSLTLTLGVSAVCFFLLYPVLTQVAVRAWGLPVLAVQTLVALLMGLVLCLCYFPIRYFFSRAVQKEESVRMERLGGLVFGLCRGVLVGLLLLASCSLLPSSALYAVLSENSVAGGWVCEHVTPPLHARLMEMPIFGVEAEQ
jgi:uncharacterized membrane protein required for colicin V production